MYYDGSFFILIPFLFLVMYAQYKVSNKYTKYSKISLKKNITPTEVCRMISQRHDLDVTVKYIEGSLTDHYNPKDKTINLSGGTGQTSVASVAVAAHEMGHAIQDKENYSYLRLRQAIVPAVMISSHIAPILIIMSFILSLRPLLSIGILFFAATVVFQIITLPVEFDASKRALVELTELGVVDQEEYSGAKEMLSAAAFTYIASTLYAIASLLRLILISRNRD